MKKLIALTLALVMALTLVACGGGGGDTNSNENASQNSGSSSGNSGDSNNSGNSDPSNDPPVNLTMAHFNVSGNPSEVLFNYVFTETYNRSGGTVEITYYPGGTLCGQSDMLDGVANRVTDIGFVQMADFLSYFPELAMVEKPGIYFASSPAICAAVGEYIETYQPEELKDYKVLTWTYGTKGCICTNVGPIRTVDDLRGQTIRAGGTMASSITAFGATPADLAMADCYEALRTGVVDGIMTLRGAMYTFNFCEVQKYGFDYPLYNSGALILMNMDAWNSLTPNQQEALQSSFDDAYEPFTSTWQNDFYKEPSARRLAEEMVEYYYPTDEEVETFRVAVEGEAKAYAESLNSRGYDGDEILQRWLDLAEKWNAVYPAKSDDDPDMYIAYDPTTGERLVAGVGSGFEWSLPYG